MTVDFRLPHADSRSPASSSPDRSRCRRRENSAFQHLQQRLLLHRRQFLASACRTPKNPLAGPLAQKALFRRIGLQNRRQGRCDFFSGARPSVPLPKRAMRGSNDLPRSRRRGAIFPLEVQELKRNHRRRRGTLAIRRGSLRPWRWRTGRAHFRTRQIWDIAHGWHTSFLE